MTEFLMSDTQELNKIIQKNLNFKIKIITNSFSFK